MNTFDSLKKEMENVPFGSSIFQINNFICDEATPERAYRKVLLQIDNKLNALKECSFNRKRLELQIRKLEENLKTLSGLDKELVEVDIEENKWKLENQIKLINDAGYELSAYQSILEKLPKPSREEFESSELEYWKKRFSQEALLSYRATGSISPELLKHLNLVKLEPKINEKKELVFYEMKLLERDEK